MYPYIVLSTRDHWQAGFYTVKHPSQHQGTKKGLKLRISQPLLLWFWPFWFLNLSLANLPTLCTANNLLITISIDQLIAWPMKCQKTQKKYQSHFLKAQSDVFKYFYFFYQPTAKTPKYLISYHIRENYWWIIVSFSSSTASSSSSAALNDWAVFCCKNISQLTSSWRRCK